GDGGQADVPVEVVEGRLDLALAEGEGDRQDADLFASQLDGDRDHEGREAADPLRPQHGRHLLEVQGPVDRTRGPGGEQARGVELALAGGEKAAAAEDVDVVANEPRDPDQGGIGDRLQD